MSSETPHGLLILLLRLLMLLLMLLPLLLMLLLFLLWQLWTNPLLPEVVHFLQIGLLIAFLASVRAPGTEDTGEHRSRALGFFFKICAWVPDSIEIIMAGFVCRLKNA